MCKISRGPLCGVVGVSGGKDLLSVGPLLSALRPSRTMSSAEAGAFIASTVVNVDVYDSLFAKMLFDSSSGETLSPTMCGIANTLRTRSPQPMSLFLLASTNIGTYAVLDATNVDIEDNSFNNLLRDPLSGGTLLMTIIGRIETMHKFLPWPVLDVVPASWTIWSKGMVDDGIITTAMTMDFVVYLWVLSTYVWVQQ